MFLENIKEAITSIFSNKMRSVLTMLGIIIDKWLLAGSAIAE